MYVLVIAQVADRGAIAAAAEQGHAAAYVHAYLSTKMPAGSPVDILDVVVLPEAPSRHLQPVPSGDGVS